MTVHEKYGRHVLSCIFMYFRKIHGGEVVDVMHESFVPQLFQGIHKPLGMPYVVFGLKNTTWNYN